MNPINRKGYRLLHEGSFAFGRAERAGIRIDEQYCHKQLKSLENKERKLEKKIFNSKPGATWRSLYGSRAKLGSPDQLKAVLKKHYGLRIEGSVDKTVLASYNLPLLWAILRVRKLHKTRTTYLRGIASETLDGYLHPFFNLHTARTYRSSSSRPNFQNIPVRDPEVAKIVRRAFIARNGHCLVEIDYGAVEVRVAACYHEDPRMIRYLKTGFDMHGEMGAECYRTKKSQVSKDMRYAAKNRFVFPEFYGSYHKQVAPDLWNAIQELKLSLNDGTSLHTHLRKRGIKNFEDFGDHIERVEDRFWYEKFARYTEWKEEWLAAYRKTGYFDLKTGFRCRGWMRRNEVINYPIQGSAFHCLLWSFTRLDEEMRKRKMRSVIVGQIHDSILADVHLNELEDYIELATYISTKAIRKHWEWITLPLIVDVEIAPPDGTWYDKKERKVV